MPRSNVYGTPTKEIDSVAVIAPVDMEIPGCTNTWTHKTIDTGEATIDTGGAKGKV